MEKDKILIHDITNLTTKTKGKGDLITSIQFDAKIPVATLAKLLELQSQRVPMTVAIGSPQTTLDI